MPRTLLLLALTLSAALATPAAGADRVMVGCFASFGDLPVEQVPWAELTHLCHAYLRIDAQGEPVRTDAVPNAALTADGRKNGVPVLLTIGGGATATGLEKATATPEGTAALVRAVLEAVYDGRYDGVDLDWDSPRDAATGAAHARLVTELRRRLDLLARRTERESPYLLTVAVSPSAFLGQWIDTRRVLPAVDWLGVRAYDLSGPWSRYAAHHAPLFASSDDPERAWRSLSAAMRYWQEERRVPKEKLVAGVPFYGRAMPVTDPHRPLDPAQAGLHRALPFSAVRGLVDEGWPAEWDQESRAPWLRKPPAEGAGALQPLDENQAIPAVVAYDDRNSVHAKSTWCREQGYRGLYFWAIHQDRMDDGEHWLIGAANKAWPAE